MHTSRFLILAAMVCVSACTPQPAPDRAALDSESAPIMRERKFERIEQWITAEFAKGGRGGVVVGVVGNGELVWARCLGMADEETGRPMTIDSVFPLASMTKMVTGIMLLQLVERGQVHLADPVERYVPEIRGIENPFPWAPPITLVQLATMTSGLERGLSVRDDLKAAVNAAKTWDEKLAAAMPSFKYRYEPGTASRYSNLGYSILGLALSRAAKRSFSEYVVAEILQPLGMRDSGFLVTSELEPRVVRGYALDEPGSPGIRIRNDSTDLLSPAAGLLSTLEDLVRLMRFQSGTVLETVLSSSMLESSYQMLVPSDANLRYGDGIGFAAVRNSDSGLTALGHGGGFSGFATSYEFDGTTRTGVILLANTSSKRMNYKVLVRQMLAILNPASPGGSGLPPMEEH